MNELNDLQSRAGIQVEAAWDKAIECMNYLKWSQALEWLDIATDFKQAAHKLAKQIEAQHEKR